MKALKQYIVVIILLIIALFLLANKLIIWGVAAVAAGMVVLGIQQLIKLNVKVSLFEDNMKDLNEKNKVLENRNTDLIEENKFLKDRHFQITQIKSILELNLFEIETRFKRAVSNEEIKDDRRIKYFGSLDVVLNARYGIDCRELRFKYDRENNELTVANIKPKFLSFGKRSLEWDFFEILEFRNQNPFAEKRWMTTDDLGHYAGRIREKFRMETERSLEKGPEEFGWIEAPLKSNVENVIRILFSGICSNIRIIEEGDETFGPLASLSVLEQRRPIVLTEGQAGDTGL